MSNTHKDGDFNLDEELRSKIVANESGQPISDEHEDETEIEVDMCPNDVTVEELHKKRIDWLKKKTDDLDIYVLRDTYLVKYQPNEREKMFYLIPT